MQQLEFVKFSAQPSARLELEVSQEACHRGTVSLINEDVAGLVQRYILQDEQVNG